MIVEMYEVCMNDLQGREVFHGSNRVCFKTLKQLKADTIEEWVKEYGEIEMFFDKFQDKEHGYFVCDAIVYPRGGSGYELERGTDLKEVISREDIRKVNLHCEAVLSSGTEIFTEIEFNISIKEV